MNYENSEKSKMMLLNFLKDLEDNFNSNDFKNILFNLNISIAETLKELYLEK